jgi:hypothetical protein
LKKAFHSIHDSTLIYQSIGFLLIALLLLAGSSKFPHYTGIDGLSLETEKSWSWGVIEWLLINVILLQWNPLIYYGHPVYILL